MISVDIKHTRKTFSMQLQSLLIWLCILLISGLVHAAPVSEQQVKMAVETWVRYVAADANPEAVIERVEPYRVEEKVYAYISHIAGGGLCISGADDLLTLPVYLYSPSGRYNSKFQFVLTNIVEVTMKLERMIERHDPELEKYSGELGLRSRFWQDLISGDIRLQQYDETLAEDPLQVVLPLTTAWHQGAPYNNLTPMGDGGRTVVGCMATAMAQIMRYWQWPSEGVGSSSYTWDGDQSCGGNTSGGDLSATYSDAYDWQNMPDDCASGCTTDEQNALAELSYEVGVSIEMDYGRCGSGAPLWAFTTGNNPLVNNFLYDSDAVYNSDIEAPLTDDKVIIAEIQWFRPVALAGCLNTGAGAHAWVALGYKDHSPNAPEFLMNLGWDNQVNVWSTWDALASSCQNYVTQIAPADSVRFVGDTAPGDGSPDNPHENIEEAIQRAPDEATLIFKAGSVNNFAANELVITKPLTLRGHNIVIE